MSNECARHFTPCPSEFWRLMDWGYLSLPAEVWQERIGDEFPRVRLAFLEAAIEAHGPGEILEFREGVNRFVLERFEERMLRLSWQRLARHLGDAFGFVSQAIGSGPPGFTQIGVVGKKANPVFVATGCYRFPSAVCGGLSEISTSCRKAFVVFFPTCELRIPKVSLETTRLRTAACILDLESSVLLAPDGAVAATEAAKALFAECVAHRLGMHEPTICEALAGLRDAISAKNDECRELREAKEALERMVRDRVFDFARVVAPADLVRCVAVLAYGDAAKASRGLRSHGLRTSDTALRQKIKDWPQKGPAYRVLANLVSLRHRLFRHKPVERKPFRLMEACDQRAGSAVDPVELLHEALEALLELRREKPHPVIEAIVESLQAGLDQRYSCTAQPTPVRGSDYRAERDL